MERKAEGLIRHLGFSFHDKADVLEALGEAALALAGGM